MPIVYKRHNLLSNTTCTPRHDKKNNFLWKKGEIIHVKCKIGLWFLSSVRSFINIYVCTKFNFKRFSTFPVMARTDIHDEKKKWLRGDNSVNIQGKLWLLCTALSVIYLYTKFHFNPLYSFQDMAQTGIHYEKWLRGDNSITIQVGLWFLCIALPLIAIYL